MKIHGKLDERFFGHSVEEPEAPMDEWFYMVSMFKFMSTCNETPPFCFEHDDAQRHMPGASDESKVTNNYYCMLDYSDAYNLETSEGRRKWKAAAPEGERIIPEDGKAWADVFYRCHILPKLMKYLGYWNLI